MVIRNKEDIIDGLEAEFARFSEQAIKRIERNEIGRRELGASMRLHENYEYRTTAIMDLKSE